MKVRPGKPEARLPNSPSRRSFLTKTAQVSAAAMIVPRYVLGGPSQTAPSDRLNIAAIGAGGMGGADLDELGLELQQNVVALCDVDERRAAPTFAKFPQARRYQDFRVMLEEMDDQIDAVVVATPDHVHAVATMAAIRRGKHVYCEKPLTRTIGEARKVAAAARQAGVVTQMGNQGHANEGARLTNEWIQAGVIGEVREVHVFTDRPGTHWKQGGPRPAETPSVPPELAWDLWLGPAPERPYHPSYVPVAWRAWWDFGTGPLGDMGCHIIDHPFWALDLGPPTTVQAYVTGPAGLVLPDGQLNRETFPHSAMITYDFPARGDQPPVRMIWYDGGLMPAKPPEMTDQCTLPSDGVLFVGSEGKMYCGSHGGMPHLIPTGWAGLQLPPQTMPRSIGHRAEWIAACKGSGTPVSNFEYSGPLTEVVLLGNLAVRAPGRRLQWDSSNLRVSNIPELNRFIHPEYREGWAL